MPKEIKVSYQWYIYGMRLFFFLVSFIFKTHHLCFIAALQTDMGSALPPGPWTDVDLHSGSPARSIDGLVRRSISGGLDFPNGTGEEGKKHVEC